MVLARYRRGLLFLTCALCFFVIFDISTRRGILRFSHLINTRFNSDGNTGRSVDKTQHIIDEERVPPHGDEPLTAAVDILIQGDPNLAKDERQQFWTDETAVSTTREPERIVLDSKMDVVVIAGKFLKEQRKREKEEKEKTQKSGKQRVTNKLSIKSQPEGGRGLHQQKDQRQNRQHPASPRENQGAQRLEEQQLRDLQEITNSAVNDSYRQRLKDMGLEPTEDHGFKSPFIINPAHYQIAKKIDSADNVTLPQASSSAIKLISIYNQAKWLNHPKHSYNRDFSACPYKCEVDLSGSRWEEADIVIFLPGYLRGTIDVPARPGPEQIWVMFFREAPPNYEYPAPYEEWKGVFNWTWTYRTDSDIFSPGNIFAWRHQDLLLTDAQYASIARKKTRTAAWWVSNCNTSSRREVYVKEMQKHIDVDIYGNCGPFKCRRREEEECRNQLNETYKFYLDFENSLCKDYITEKFYRLFEHRIHTVPVVRGGADYAKYFPSGAFVNAADFPNATALAKHLKKLGDDIEAYAAMLKEKDKLHTLDWTSDWCDVCTKVHTKRETKIIPDIKAWSHGEGVCTKPADLNRS